MPKAKLFLKENSKKKSKHAARLPSSVEEYLEDGVAFEEAGEKWRGGDAAKSTRFFVRAIDCYDEGLKKHPLSFDLAYNKARIQFELTQYPKLLQQLPGTLLELLQTALESTRWALKLNTEDANTLFNTAQILTSIFEADEQSTTSQIQEPLQLLEEALQLFSKCLAKQEEQAQASQVQTVPTDGDDAMDAVDDDEEGGVSISDTASIPQDDRWASIVEPITNDTLLDTLLIQLETLTTLVKAVPQGHTGALDFASEYAASILDERLAKYLIGTNRELDASLARANFICAFSEAQFIASLLPITAYTTTIESAYSAIDLSTHAQGLCDLAESMLSYNGTISAHPEGNAPPYLAHRWKTLSLALKSFTSASKLHETDNSPIFNLPKIHIKRGDCELLRCQLGQVGYEPAVTNAGVLLKNASKFYAGAEANAKVLGLQEEATEAVVKGALVRAMQGETDDFKGLLSGGLKAPSGVEKMIEEMLQDGLVSSDQLMVLQK